MNGLEISKETADYYRNRTHKHEFVIPVEWEYKSGRARDWGQTVVNLPSTHKRVTKLRCSCGEEVKRA